MWEKLLRAGVSGSRWFVLSSFMTEVWFSLPSLLFKRGMRLPPYRENSQFTNHVRSGWSLGDFSARPTNVSVSRHDESEQFCVFWTVRPTWTPSERWDKQCGEMFQEGENWREQDASNLSSPPCLGLANHQIWRVCRLFIINCPLGEDFSSLSHIEAADSIHGNESAHINHDSPWIEENKSYWIINLEKLHRFKLRKWPIWWIVLFSMFSSKAECINS